MKFSQLYKDNREAVERALRAMWCGESGNESQLEYSKNIRETIKELFAPTTAIPVVQCMNSYESVHSVDKEIAKGLVNGLWKKDFSPYEHQYQCWHTLLEEKTQDGKPMSICVTTGTGSGKTECFMIPLVKDLIDKHKQDQIQALFLYPLNALMEDQKERLEEFLEGTNLTYSVYNGDLPEDEPGEKDFSDQAERIRKRIQLIRGYNEKTGEYRYKHMLYTRKMVRKNPPNILLTNPTMLEYILLRGKDAVLTNPILKSLSWVTIDETHTYTGAGAAELAMLLRRVVLAFGVSADQIHFATSSATFGNGTNPQEEEKQLKSFISGITGTDFNQVKVINGKRIGEDAIPQNEDTEKWQLLFQREYVRLNELFAGDGNIEEKLELLDEMCCRVPTNNNVPTLKAKVHYFYRVPNNGLFVRLTEHTNGAFKIYNLNNITEDTKENPLLELCRCKHCGEYVALAQINKLPGEDFGKYKAIERSDEDLFDIEELNEDKTDTDYAIIGLSKSENLRGDNNVTMDIIKGKLIPSTGEVDTSNWHLVANTQCCCPYCNSKLTRRKDSDDETDADANEPVENAYLQKFRTSPEFISRVMANSVLSNLDKATNQPPEKIILHDGQQYISFADSRQLAAKATLKQNLEQERDWFYSTIYHALCKQQIESSSIDSKIAELTSQLPSLVTDTDKMMEVATKINKLKGSKKDFFTWLELVEILKKDKFCKVFCSQFVQRSGDSEEVDKKGNIPNFILEKYVHSIMVMYLSSRPLSSAAPETLGLFCTYYPQIAKISLPNSVKRFNELLSTDSLKISQDDWHSIIQIFMDYTVRSNQSLFLKLSDKNPLDIFACERFVTEKPHRRPVNKPKIEPNKQSSSRIVKYLCELLAEEKNIPSNEAYKQFYDYINQVMESLWSDVTDAENDLLELSEHWDKDTESFAYDRDNALRFNLRKLCFKLYDNVYLCDTNTDASLRHSKCYRPIGNHFKNFSPYLHGNKVVRLDEALHEHWKTFPFYKGSGNTVSAEQVRTWAQDNRKLLWNYGMWGENGAFENRLTNIHLVPNVFIQAEHTAQVDKDVSRTLQTDFKEHSINILACSTTMEMGVDLGNLEVVMLTSVPPQPSNYKQRAGRSGRNNKVQSVCITLCGSDAIGLRTLFNPISTIINRPVQVPMVDLMSPQVVQRHVNSYLVRTFGVFKDGENGGKLTQKVFNFYSRFVDRRSGHKIEIVDSATNDETSPNDKLGDKQGTMYELFNTMCMQALPDSVRTELCQLLHGTVFEDHPEYVVEKAHEANKRCYAELNTKLEDLQMVYQGAKDKFRTKLKMQYYEVLLTRLLDFWATSRFTPNANMPVNVLTLDLNSTGKKSIFTTATSSNPSYGLREAISQYAPGNNIVVDGVGYIVRGIEFTNMYQGVKAFKQIYRNNDKCVIDDSTIDGKIRWRANDKDNLELIQPVGFVPDMNEDKSRIMETNKYTHVSAQLIDTTDWADNVTEPHLFSVRSNRETGYAKILYYNEGIGYGYCFCSRCGRMTLETEAADPDDVLDNLPPEMNNKRSKKEGRPNYHFEIFGKEFRHACGGSNDKNLIRRNVIIGDLVQTDFSEIRIRHKGQKKWMNSRSEENLMFTLGVVFTQSLLDILGKERGAVDFTVMPNGHLCLFDTNPGGAGYSNQMASVPLMKDVINKSKEMLEEAKAKNSKDFLLNKFTLRFIDYIDIDSALAWINEEEEARGILPEDISSVSKESTETSIANLQDAFNNSANESTIFINDNYDKWDYDGTTHSWRGHFLNYLHVHNQMTTVCIIKHSKLNIPEPALEMLRSAKGWAKDILEMNSPYAEKEIYPIAYVSGVLYFTNNVEYSSFNDTWGNATLYCARVENIIKGATKVDCSYKETTKVFKLEGQDDVIIRTSDLGELIYNKSTDVIDSFFDYCHGVNDKLIISYQDEHLKSVMGMVLTLQTIEYFIREIGKDFTISFLVEKYEDANYKGSVTANLMNHHQRDSILEDLTTGWINDIHNKQGIDGNLVPIESNQYNTLTHWRVLTLKCGNRRLSIYPDGGFANGWNILRDWTINTKHFSIDNTDSSDIITLKRSKDIKFDVTVEEL